MKHGLPDGEYIFCKDGFNFDVVIFTNEKDIKMVKFLDFPDSEPEQLADQIGQFFVK
jgi:hypothetical protein